MADEKKPAAATAEKKTAKAEDVPDTPSGKALAEVGEAPEFTGDNQEAVLEHAAKYEVAKRKARWGED